jgi:hypothetical protein
VSAYIAAGMAVNPQKFVMHKIMSVHAEMGRAEVGVRGVGHPAGSFTTGLSSPAGSSYAAALTARPSGEYPDSK